MYTAQGFAHKTRVKKTRDPKNRGGLVVDVDFASGIWLVLWDGTNVPQRVCPSDCTPETALTPKD